MADDRGQNERETPVDAVRVAPRLHQYSVQVVYTEPGYAASRGIEEARYQGTFEVDAPTIEEAMHRGLDAFRVCV